MANRNLRDLLAPLGIQAPYKVLKKITLDSRNVAEGDLFFAINGNQTDGRKYIAQAIERGVAAVIAETNCALKSGKIKYMYDVPIISVNNLKNQLSFLAGEFYQHPATKLRLVGITGTNGKTTTTHLIAQWANGINETSAVMSTVGNGILEHIVPSKNTTSSAVDIQNELQLLVNKNATLVAIEVSSHGLVQGRVSALPFTATVFTNISHEHLDYHGDLQSYKDAKWLLFSTHKSDKQIINVDDDTGLQWLQKLPHACAVSIKDRIPPDWLGAWVLVEKINYHQYGTSIHFNSTWGKGSLKSPLIGIFNVNNVMLAMATLLMMGYSFDSVIKSANVLQPVCGRMEIFISTGYPTVIIDYAHTPDALKKALMATRLHYQGKKLWCIFGCGGNRDKSKRAFMGRIAEQYADTVVITNDNPRSEKSNDIIKDILNGFLNSSKAVSIIDRVQAITNVIINANVEDVILIAGKGHEDYQIIGNRRIEHSDRLTVARLLGIMT
ncbi:UDP-N-acetylmuramoyl-L-alanyl-D-glutamate--2,6-diaminopimelate ligase [Arsenophonus sp.]|uniref:UDP-N-acetylmuramoyl-L-alanyl-D-glutamate--2, 6-diaminopimelate ligase n=1 Tax=Arsenophonus sp. TaxID=1872640 RepID=UPI00286691E3|nr:UDP-N-acetylmuramoyl-L-alanyl-D-glutamate--2,6-diaminopimelate ligase [Arsenophonus sp.]MDR5615677.1 UDP-N-acetylmuramoyl-L-alanyl-D-glutamate--2,6-diaminopimelate ligase [Arsenophonus sp.]